MGAHSAVSKARAVHHARASPSAAAVTEAIKSAPLSTSATVAAHRTNVSKDITNISATGPRVSVHAADTSTSTASRTTRPVSSRADLRSPRRAHPISRITLLTAQRSMCRMQKIVPAASAAHVSRRG
jgi:hypothetical protein